MAVKNFFRNCILKNLISPDQYFVLKKVSKFRNEKYHEAGDANFQAKAGSSFTDFFSRIL